MKVHYLHREQALPIEPDVAWAFFSNPANQLALAPPWASLEDISHTQSKTIYNGLLQKYRMTLPGGRCCLWTAEFKHVSAPHGFVKEQRLGPFAFWHHRHEIVPSGKNVIIRDRLHYALPLGFIGELAHTLFVRNRLKRLFDYRADALMEFFGEE